MADRHQVLIPGPAARRVAQDRVAEPAEPSQHVHELPLDRGDVGPVRRCGRVLPHLMITVSVTMATTEGDDALSLYLCWPLPLPLSLAGVSHSDQCPCRRWRSGQSCISLSLSPIVSYNIEYSCVCVCVYYLSVSACVSCIISVSVRVCVYARLALAHCVSLASDVCVHSM